MDRAPTGDKPRPASYWVRSPAGEVEADFTDDKNDILESTS